MSGRLFFRITLKVRIPGHSHRAGIDHPHRRNAQKVAADNCRNQAISLKTRRGPNGTILPFA
jgi:hypothetical protein